MVRLLLPAATVCMLLTFDAGAQADYKRFFDEDRLPMMRELYSRGRYSLIIQNSNYAIQRGQPSPEWRTLRMRSLAALGKYEDAVAEADTIAGKFGDDLFALLEIHEMYRTTGREAKRDEILDEINDAAAAVPVQDRDALDLVLLGRAALALGADPALVLEQYFTPAKQTEKRGREAPPGLVEAHRAAGDLALEKSDFKLAAEEFREALRYRPNDPDLRFGLARAFLPDDRKAGMEEIAKVLERHSFHFGALLIQAEYAINFEKYDEARTLLGMIHGINPRHPEAWALFAVLAELEENDDELFEVARQRALEVWQRNPEIDHLIGRVLSRNYRFAEGAESQNRALAFDPGFLPAKLQLALDYLRLGQVEQAWPLAREVADADPYNVLAYNLDILQQEMASFTTVESDHFIIRMPRNEADLYGDRALELLEEARLVLCPKYDVELEEKTQVEFFPDQADFAIRSFGSLGGAGLLGVCFGSVVTMNSPGSLTSGKNNWEATLWHEFCHVVTLTATKNRMPRWLSEGISVYEEMQRQSNWGQRMTPRYRRMILEEDALTPISQMSSAFYTPPSPTHVMFAYYQSMLVVEHIVENFGMEALRAILADLAEGRLINDAIARHTKPLVELEADFAEETLELARNLGPGVDWTVPDPSEVNPQSRFAVAAYRKRNPQNFWAHQTYTRQLLEARQWEEAVRAADDFIDLYPDYVDGVSNGYSMKATAYRALDRRDLEAETLRVLSEKSAEAFQAYQVLLELDLEAGNWAQLLANADRAMAINPFLHKIHYCRGCAAEEMGRPDEAIRSFEKLLSLRPANPSDVRFRLARLHKPRDLNKAKRYVIDALADSPRYREAFRLLLALEEKEKPEIGR